MNKRGQVMGIPFQIIFSIILIAVFLYVAIIVIKSFMINAERMKLATFVSDFRNDLEKAMSKYSFSETKKYEIPKSITNLCFTTDAQMMNPPSSLPSNIQDELKKAKTIYAGLKNKAYVFFLPFSKNEKNFGAYAIVDCEIPCLNITQTKNPICINSFGTVSITITKNAGEAFVTIK